MPPYESLLISLQHAPKATLTLIQAWHYSDKFGNLTVHDFELEVMFKTKKVLFGKHISRLKELGLMDYERIYKAYVLKVPKKYAVCA